jgi:hypothetical protein
MALFPQMMHARGSQMMHAIGSHENDACNGFNWLSWRDTSNRFTYHKKHKPTNLEIINVINLLNKFKAAPNGNQRILKDHIWPRGKFIL